MKNLSLLLFILIFISCGGDECRNDITGTYTGTSTCPHAPEGEIIISESPDGDSEVLIQDGIDFITGFRGELSGKCKTISIPPQSVTDINGQGYEISGTFDINGSNITGELTFDQGSLPFVCSYDLVKN